MKIASASRALATISTRASDSPPPPGASSSRRKAANGGQTARKTRAQISRDSAQYVVAVKSVANARRKKQEQAFDQGVKNLDRYVRRYGHADVPVQYVQTWRGTAFHLGHWVRNQRAKRSRGEMPPEWAALLEERPGWVWAALERGWDDALAALRAFMTREGHARVPLRHKEGDFALGGWVARMRRRMRTGALPRDKQAVLEGIPHLGESWKRVRTEQVWLDKLGMLRRYTQRHGDTNVPRGYIENDRNLGAVNLGVWVNSMRSLHNRGELPRQRIRLLEEIPGWHWATPRGGPPAKAPSRPPASPRKQK